MIPPTRVIHTCMNFTFGWRPDLPDHRDHYFSSVSSPVSLPSFVDLRKFTPTAFNQFELGSCTANAVAAAMETNQIKQNAQIFIPSRLFIYYNTRSIEGTVNEDSGATLRNTIKAVAKWGVGPETDWPYHPNYMTRFREKPTNKVYEHASWHKAVSYQRLLGNSVSTRSCLASGFPFVYGFSVYESFMGETIAKTGIMEMPKASDDFFGGHAVMAVGYNDGPDTVNGVPPRTFIVRNSYSPRWGVKGHFFMPYEYMFNDDLCADFWTIRLVSDHKH